MLDRIAGIFSFSDFLGRISGRELVRNLAADFFVFCAKAFRLFP